MDIKMLRGLCVVGFVGVSASVEAAAPREVVVPGERILESRLQQSGAHDGNTRLTRDDSGQVIAMELDLEGERSGTTQRYTYDEQGRVSSWREDGPGADDVTTEHYQYDSLGRLVHLTHDAPGTHADWYESYAFDAEGRMTYLERGEAGSLPVSETYEYDEAGRLVYWFVDGVGYWRDFYERYAYDAHGRMVFFQRGTYGIEWVTEHYTYDASGTLVSVHSPPAGAP